jgi:hypothetical protein
MTEALRKKKKQGNVYQRECMPAQIFVGAVAVRAKFAAVSVLCSFGMIVTVHIVNSIKEGQKRITSIAVFQFL